MLKFEFATTSWRGWRSGCPVTICLRVLAGYDQQSAGRCFASPSVVPPATLHQPPSISRPHDRRATTVHVRSIFRRAEQLASARTGTTRAFIDPLTTPAVRLPVEEIVELHPRRQRTFLALSGLGEATTAATRRHGGPSRDECGGSETSLL